MNDTVELARRLARIARDNELAEIDYRNGETRIRLLLEVEQVVAAPPMMAMAAAAPGPTPSPPPAAPAAPEPAGEFIRSPLAGVFYRAPRPGVAPYVEAGQSVSKGATLCIVEAMKLMNELTAERACKVLEILVDNGDAVEQGQPLFAIEPVKGA